MESLIDRLARARIGRTFNFYRDGDGAARRLERLGAYLTARTDAPILLVGEAPGYRGARVSGIPFTSERQLTGDGPAEATATVVQRVLAELGIADEVLLWNVVPTHPGTASSNRPPTSAEVAAGLPYVAQLAEGRRVVAVGRVAQRALGSEHVSCEHVRHPSHGGAAAFRSGLAAVLAGQRTRKCTEPVASPATIRLRHGSMPTPPSTPRCRRTAPPERSFPIPQLSRPPFVAARGGCRRRRTRARRSSRRSPPGGSTSRRRRGRRP